MPSNLAARPSNLPLPMGTILAKKAVSYGGVVWPNAENYLWGGPGSGGQTGGTGTFRRPERFWLFAGASVIAMNGTAGTWTRHDYQLRLVVNGAYANDLNGINFFLKAGVAQGVATDPWNGMSISGLFYCEANTDYEVYLLSKNNPTGISYWQSPNHYNLWAYTLGEGVY